MKLFCSSPKFVQNLVNVPPTRFNRIVTTSVQCNFVPFQALATRVPPARTPKEREERYNYRSELEKSIKEATLQPLTPSQLAMFPPSNQICYIFVYQLEKQRFQPHEVAPLRLMKPANSLPLRASLVQDVTVPVVNFANETVQQITLSKEIFLAPIRTDLIHRCVIWQLACARKGLAKGKNRAEVSGGGRKPYKQKGMGMARAGSTISPNRKGGGRAFPPVPRSYVFPLPIQVRQFGLRSALSAKFAQSKLFVVDSGMLESHKTKDLSEMLEKNGWSNALIIDGETVSRNLELASSNIKTVEVLAAEDINVYKILKHDVLVLSVHCVKYLENVYFKELLENQIKPAL